MLTNDAIKEAISVAQEFDRRELILTPTSGTPLAALCEASTLCDAQDVGQTAYEPDPLFIEQQSAGWTNGAQSAHDALLSDMVVDIAGHVQNHLQFAKTVVRPVIQELVTEVEERIKALPLSLEYALDIVVLDPPEPMISPAFEEMVAEFKEVAYVPVTDYMSLPLLSGAEVLSHMATGAAETDEAVAIWAAKKGDAFFQHVWECVFTASPTAERFDNLIQDRRTGTDAALTVFLLCKRMYDNPIEGVVMTLPDFNGKIAQLRNQAALRLSHAYEEYARDSKMNLLIKNYSNQEVVVNGNVYRKWLEEGGNNAVIFGSMLTDRPAKFVMDLDGKRAELLALWERHNQMLTVGERNRRFVRYKDILRGSLHNLVAGEGLQRCFGHLAQGDIPVTTNQAEYQQFLANVDQFVDSLREVDFKNLWELSLQAVCQCMFFYTDADRILGGIERACTDNEGIEIREAALLSLIDYVVDYVCNQMTLSGV